MNTETIVENFEAWASEKGFDLAFNFFSDNGRDYVNEDTRLAFEIWKASQESCSITPFDAETIRLARLVAQQPEPPTDPISIVTWAARLADDIVKVDD